MRSSEKRTRRSFVSFVLLALWAVFSLSLTGWWYIYSQQQIERLLALDHESSVQLARHQTMLMWEGAALILSLLIGALVAAYFIRRDQRQSRQILDFFLTFAHEVKTPLTSLRLQAESLEEELTDPEALRRCQRLRNEADRLALQLENSLWLTNIEDESLFLTSVSLTDIVESVQLEFPELRIRLSENAVVLADPQALRVVLRNLARNALLHGKATELKITCSELDPERISIEVEDNGDGFQGESKLIGSPFVRPYPGSGSGIGLYICKRLIEKMRGDFSIRTVGASFGLRFALPGDIRG